MSGTGWLAGEQPYERSTRGTLARNSSFVSFLWPPAETLEHPVFQFPRSELKKPSAEGGVLCYTLDVTTLPIELQDMVEHSGDLPVRVVDPRT